MIEKTHCFLIEDNKIGEREAAHKHQRLGIKGSLLLKQKGYKPSLFQKEVETLSKAIHGSAINSNSGL